MVKLNNDILYLVFKELHDDEKTLYSCLTVNKTFCEIIIPILWKDPWKYFLRTWKCQKLKLLIKVIISHLSDEAKNELSKDIHFLKDSYKKPLINYIEFCKHLNLNEIQRIISMISEISEKRIIIRNEIINLFINGNVNFTHLYIPQQFDDYQLSREKFCYSKIVSLSCNARINDNILNGLIKISESIKDLELLIEDNNNNYNITRLIDTSKKLINVRLVTNCSNFPIDYNNEPFYRILENSLMKHANNIQYFKMTIPPTTKILSSLANLKRFEFGNNNCDATWSCLEHLSLPFLEVLKADYVPAKALISLIENTGGCLTEIKIGYMFQNKYNNKLIIRAIYNNCPNLQYLKLLFRNDNMCEIEKLLIKCQHLNGLFLIINSWINMFEWNKLFNILTKASPPSLFKFKFSIISRESIRLEFLKSFFNNWKGRKAMLLELNFRDINEYITDLINLVEKYKAEGVIKKFKKYNSNINDFDDDFEWI
ncbi:hypothetical protein RclHR1_00060021 [Rhizophagus clarus]|uniref:F-box domain-containing protein n=1 Tax=Rhizophagus clarus TaxID=94130 RepID=A0A2Z6RPR7_9GLOM|nr:hypothetical protein RclHR1_00060021 [Rhizophagus clarus]GES74572.1 hypothetical protein GLOIN_2v1866989 [Rhizophagus clarus]